MDVVITNSPTKSSLIKTQKVMIICKITGLLASVGIIVVPSLLLCSVIFVISCTMKAIQIKGTAQSCTVWTR